MVFGLIWFDVWIILDLAVLKATQGHAYLLPVGPVGRFQSDSDRIRSAWGASPSSWKEDDRAIYTREDEDGT